MNNRLIMHLNIRTKYNGFHYPVGQIWLAGIFMEVVMEYGYIRVSSKEQNIDRQMAALLKEGLDKKHIFIDKQSGKDFDRPSYKSF